MKIVGVEERIGVFEKTPYHNVKFHCAEEFKNDDKSKGLKVSVVKIGYKALTKIFGKELTTSEIKSFVGGYIEAVHYNGYGNVSLIEFDDSIVTSKKISKD